MASFSLKLYAYKGKKKVLTTIIAIKTDMSHQINSVTY